MPKRQAEAEQNRAKLAILQKQKALKLVAALNAKMATKETDESKAEVAEAEVAPPGLQKATENKKSASRSASRSTDRRRDRSRSYSQERK